MANELKMAIVQAIEQLLTARWSHRRIARQLGIDRGTVARYARSLQAEPKPAIPPTGCDESKAAIPPGPPARGGEASDRNEDAAGEEAQVDFGTGAPVVGPDGKRRRTHVFRAMEQLQNGSQSQKSAHPETA